MPTTDINLIPEQNFEDQPTSRKLFIWMTGVGRVIIIVTELIAVLVWLSRFRLDYEILTLQESIEEKAALVETSARFEKNFLKYQHKTELIKSIQAEKQSYSTGLETLATLVPEKVRITTLSFSANSIRIQAQADSAISFAEMVAALLQEETVESVGLSSTRFESTDNTYLFTLAITVSEELFNND